MGKPTLKVGGNAKGAKRRKNAGVGVDFKRVKAKVGKKLKKAQNETDASFKSATINLPSQTVAQDKDGVAVNNQNLTLHVRPGVRRTRQSHCGGGEASSCDLASCMTMHGGGIC
eukprot:352598-Chlamydomonas_euryale.AAC.27